MRKRLPHVDKIVGMRVLAFCLSLLFTSVAVGNEPASSVSFVNDVIPVLSKAGCNQGRCHASSTGKGGFQLSLRGFAPERDHLALTRDLFDRRVSVVDPDASLVLQKPSQGVPHQGGEVLPKGSNSYRILREWIAEGARGPDDRDPQVVEVRVSKTDVVLEPGTKLQLSVNARFSDGSEREVREWSLFDSNDAQVATVDGEGVTRASLPGIAAVSATYQGLVAAVKITVPFPRAAEALTAGYGAKEYAALPRNNYIDDLVIAQWKKLRLWPSATSDDATFMRRVYLGLTGRIPRPKEVHEFLGSRDERKREVLVDRLLPSADFVDMWTQKWGDIFRVSREWIGENSVWTFNEYLRDRFRRNVPWNQVASELIAGSGDASKIGPPNFYRLQRVYNDPTLQPFIAAETTSQIFLGRQIGCARCHNHPFERWTQSDYYGMVSYFAHVGEKGPKRGGKTGVIVHDRLQREINHPRLGKPIPPTPLGARRQPEKGSTRRHDLAHWITSPTNPYFARATANRVWRHFMSTGIVEPVDDFRASNPPSNEALLDALAQDLVDHGFDIRHLMKRILSSHVYQLSSMTTDQNRDDGRFYSHFYPKRMTAEQILDALGDLTGNPLRISGLPANFRAQRLPDTQFKVPFLDSFGRPLRRLASCECERIQQPNLAQALELMNSDLLHDMVTSDAALVQHLLKRDTKITETQLIEEIYVSSLGRTPSQQESNALLREWRLVADALAPDQLSKIRREFFEDLLWAVINNKEFLFSF